MRPSDNNKAPYVALVEKFEADNRNNARVRVRWYYRSGESLGGRRQFHGAKELFLADHFDVQSAHTIEGKGTVCILSRIILSLKMLGQKITIVDLSTKPPQINKRGEMADEKINRLDTELARYKEQIKKTGPGRGQEAIKARTMRILRECLVRPTLYFLKHS